MLNLIYSIANQKGGVGKTTTAVNLASSLSYLGKKILLVDFDSQGNATLSSGFDKDEIDFSIYDFLLNPNNLDEKKLNESVIKKTEFGFDLIASNSDLIAAEVELNKIHNKEMVLKNKLNGLKKNYDFVLIDCLPSLNILTINALTASDGILIPIQCEYFALEGLSDLLKTISAIQDKTNENLEIAGIVRTMFDPRNKLSSDVSIQLVKYFGKKVFSTLVPRNIRLAEAPSFGMPVMHFEKNSKGSMAYLALANEILKFGTNTKQ